MSEDKSDLTRIEDLGEFIHENDDDVEAALEDDSGPPEATSIDDLEASTEVEEVNFESNLNEEEEKESLHELSDNSDLTAEETLDAMSEESTSEFLDEGEQGPLEETNGIQEQPNEFQEEPNEFQEDKKLTNAC